MRKTTFTSTLASFGLIFTAAIWGFSFVIVKDSLDYVGAVYMIALRYTLAAVVMSLIFIKRWKYLNKQTLKHGFISGCFLFMGYITQTIGCNFTTAGKNAFLTTIYVILIPFICWIMYKKRPGWYVFVAAFMSITGIGLLALGTGDSKGLNIGDTLTLICGLFFALHIVFSERYANKGDDPLLLTLLQFITSALLGWFCAPFFDGPVPVAALGNLRVVGSLFYLGIFSTMVGFSLQNIGLKYVQSSIASILLSFESVFGVLFSTILLHETLTTRMIFGCGLIFGALLLAECLKKDSK